ncbi:transcription termination factor NusA [Leptotrichia wadei]|uniref:Transcription termination/antitermination protein NusA n=1 Tax=Leptotrichia wadei TaxID=157687 RepID=A0A510KHE5_9FUSO|nr:transcription termination factor NusA [Leptotrichia wadei]BBM50091.1 transcription elongation factor NusA [Leptotrichia wadei]
MKGRDQKIFLEALDELEKEKGILKEELLETIETALLAAYKKNYGEKDNVKVTINRNSGDVKVYSQRLIVENVENPEEEISLEDATSVKKRAKLGDILDLEINAESFKRNAIQNAKQIVVQKVRECEKRNIFNKFKEIENSIVSANVRKTDEKGNLYVDINGLEAIVPQKELSPTDKFVQGDRIKIFIGEVEEATKFTKTFVSRKSEELLRGLLELEVPEIYEGIIEIKNIAREAGSRSKVAVYSNDKNLDVKGACIGRNGMRIQTIIDELQGEKIDVVLWNEDVREFVKNALNPAQVLSVEIVEEGEDNLKVAKVVVAENQLSLAIGKKGQNSRLAARLCGVKIDIHTGSDKMAGSEEDEFKEKSAFQDSLDETENTEKTSDSQNDIEVEESAFAGLSEDNE